MFCSRKLNNLVNRIHVKVLQLVYKDFQSTFHELLSRDNSLNIYQLNQQKLRLKVFKVTSFKIMNKVFNVVDLCYSLINKPTCREGLKELIWLYIVLKL